jgi:transcriptional regulator with XRE-family HTH domain
VTRLAEFCQVLRDARLARRMSQNAVGAALGVSGVSVGDWERGKSRPTDAHLLAWAGLLEVEVPDGLARGSS